MQEVKKNQNIMSKKDFQKVYEVWVEIMFIKEVRKNLHRLCVSHMFLRN